MILCACTRRQANGWRRARATKHGHCLEPKQEGEGARWGGRGEKRGGAMTKGLSRVNDELATARQELSKRNAELEAELARREAAEAALRESAARLRVAVTGSPDAIFYLDLDLRCTWVANPRPPFTEERVLGKTLLELFEPEEGERAAAVCRRVLETGVGARVELGLGIAGVERWFELAI